MPDLPPIPTRLLLVDDDDHVRRSLHLLLESLGYSVRAYPQVDDLVRDSDALNAVCLIADLDMPQKSGIDLLAEMRAKGWLGKSILISGYPVTDWHKYVKLTGFDAALTKPLGASVLVRTINRLLNGDITQIR